ncbi:MAG: hybrid sensor histidine kinase/response regulator, partial [Desulfobulbaceae bacterium]
GLIDDGGLLAFDEDFEANLITEEPFEPDQLTSDQDSELYEIFLMECEEHLLVIGKALSGLEQQVVDTSQLSTGTIEHNLAELRRAIHTLKGAAGMTGFTVLADIAHLSEDLLDAIFEAGTVIEPSEVSVLSEAVSIIEVLSADPKKNKDQTILSIQKSISSALEKRGVTPALTLTEAAEITEPETEVRAEAEDESSVVSAESGNIRVSLESLDEIVGLEGELVVARGTMERGLDELIQTVNELNLAKEKLKRISQELETGFEVESLYGFGVSPVGVPVEAEQLATTGYSDFDPIELDRYSQLSLIIRSLNELSVDVNSIHSEMVEVTSELRGHMARQQLMMGVIQDKMMRVRLTPMSSVSRTFFRAVRQAADELGKKVRLNIVGDDVYLDRFVWNKVSDPVMHILRNAVDHGIESEDVRTSSGKPELATIEIEAVQQGNQVVLRISDDGAGVDLNAIRARMDEGTQLSDDQLFEKLFTPGFSTRTEVSQLSGRGVGLDVVRQNLYDLRGSVTLSSVQGGGTTFELRIPVTLSLNRAVIVSAANEQFAVPIHEVLEIRKVTGEQARGIGRGVLETGERVLPCKQLWTLVGLESSQDSVAHVESAIVLIVRVEGVETAVQVDTIIGQREIVVKDLGTHLKKVRGIAGATIMGDGSLLPILDVQELVASEPGLTKKAQPEQLKNLNRDLRVLVVDDSVSVRQSVSRLIRLQGWTPEPATDGVDALEKLDRFSPDIIVLDIEMPRMNGFEFMGVLRSNESHGHIPVIMLTSRVSEKHQQKALQLGVNHYQVKPYKEDEFIQLIRECI